MFSSEMMISEHRRFYTKLYSSGGGGWWGLDTSTCDVEIKNIRTRLESGVALRRRRPPVLESAGWSFAGLDLVEGSPSAVIVGMTDELCQLRVSTHGIMSRAIRT